MIFLLQDRVDQGKLNGLYFIHLHLVSLLSPTSAKPPLKRKSHQSRVQQERQKQMSQHNRQQRPDGNNHLDLPHTRYDANTRSEHNHHEQDNAAHDKGILERFQDARDLVQEGDVVDFFACGAPLHVDGEHVREDCLPDVD
jgi:hypothetical protein